ncbi:hypothetical protein ABH922_001257 [Rhodococcus sp. 27YEA15]|uniref:hypothetical protein n=1 Tax=Rhodococcus sp. 27YEA15 TaxID=3156259 RepID=UPI003C7CCAA8
MAVRTERQRRVAAARNALRADPWYQLLDEAIADRRRRQRMRGPAYGVEGRVDGAVVSARLARRAAASAAILERYGSKATTEVADPQGSA